MFILYMFAIIFVLFAIYFGLKNIKEESLRGISAIKTFLIYIFFGISMALFCIFININYIVSIVIFLCLSWIIIISSMIDSRKFSLVVCDLFICTISIIFLLVFPISDNIRELWIFILLLSLYLLPILSCFDKKRDLIKKINKCTYEVDAIVKEVFYYKKRNIYIPKLEFEFNGKKYKYTDNDTLCFSDEIKKGDTIPLLINPSGKSFSKNSNNVFFPGNEINNFISLSVKIWYVLTFLIFILILIFYNA